MAEGWATKLAFPLTPRRPHKEHVATHPDLEAEQSYIDHAYQRLEAMRAISRQMMEGVLDRGKGGTPQARAERDVIVRSSLHRLEQLDIGYRSLCFGRIDQAPAGPDDSGAGETFYIGRLAISGEHHEPLVVDWRAPVAEPFYRATGRHPMGLTRRRHFATDGPRLLAIEDELFSVQHYRAGRSHSRQPPEPELVGSSVLIAALERSRTPHMSDIVATVQVEQDQVIRAPLPGVLVVQGGPGTGKTAVALHRAAYLLYTHRFPLERQGVLVVGPNQVFLRYISQVLPSLGESGVTLSTVGGLYSEARATGREDRNVASLKGQAAMAQVIAKAVRDRQRPLAQDVTVPFGSAILRISPVDSAEAVAAARRRRGPHNAKRRFAEAVVVNTLAAQYARARARAGQSVSWSQQVDEEELAGQIRRLPEVTEAVQRIWPKLSERELLHDLFGAKALIQLAGRQLLSPTQVSMLYRPRSGSMQDIAWTEADLALLDEARVLLGSVGKSAGEDEPRTYGHIVVDEAQDLSPMQLRMLARRSMSGSMTVVGDVAQSTSLTAPDSWDEVTAHLPQNRPSRLAELSVNYRTSAEVMEVAGRVLALTAPQLRSPRSVRSSGEPARTVRVDGDELAREVAETAKAELLAVGEGTVGVICPSTLVAALAEAMAPGGANLPLSVAASQGLGPAITLTTLDVVKGLEFDAVLVVEPSELVAESGLRGLYVALSRPTRRLAILHSGPLPDALSGVPALVDVSTSSDVLGAAGLD